MYNELQYINNSLICTITQSHSATGRSQSFWWVPKKKKSLIPLSKKRFSIYERSKVLVGFSVKARSDRHQIRTETKDNVRVTAYQEKVLIFEPFWNTETPKCAAARKRSTLSLSCKKKKESIQFCLTLLYCTLVCDFLNPRYDMYKILLNSQNHSQSNLCLLALADKLNRSTVTVFLVILTIDKITPKLKETWK